MRPTRRGCLKTLAAGALAALGCREELGPEPMPTTRVVGRVHDRSRPIGGGWVEFLPIDGTVGLLRSAPLRPDGMFEVDHVGLGRHAIMLAHPAAVLPGGRLFQGHALIRRDVRDTPTTTLDIDVHDEWLRYLYLREHPAG